MPFTLRPATSSDAVALHHLAAATFPLACPPGTDPADVAAHIDRHLSVGAFEGHLADPDHTVLVVVDAEAGAHREAGAAAGPSSAPGAGPDTGAGPGTTSDAASGASGALLGYAMLVAGEPTDADVAAALTVRPTVLLDKFYLLPRAQGTGAAGALLAAVTDAARATGASGLWLGVNRQNRRAGAFYEKSGLRVVGARRFRVGDVVHDDDVRELVLDAE